MRNITENFLIDLNYSVANEDVSLYRNDLYNVYYIIYSNDMYKILTTICFELFRLLNAVYDARIEIILSKS